MSGRMVRCCSTWSSSGWRRSEAGEPELEPVRYILRRRGEGAPFRAIAAELTAQGIPTKRGGGRWHGSTVRQLWQGRDRYAAPDAVLLLAALVSLPLRGPQRQGTLEHVAVLRNVRRPVRRDLLFAKDRRPPGERLG